MSLNIRELLTHLDGRDRQFAQYFIDEGNFYCLSVFLGDIIEKEVIINYNSEEIDKLSKFKTVIDELLQQNIIT